MYITRITCWDLDTALTSLNTLNISPIARMYARSALRGLPDPTVDTAYRIVRLGKSLTVGLLSEGDRTLRHVWNF